MRFLRDETFLRERSQFRLRHTCEYCAFFDPTRGVCVHGWPNREHRETYYDAEDSTMEREVVFCKEFELDR